MNISEYLKLASTGSYDALSKKLDTQDQIFKRNALNIFGAIQNQNMEENSLLFLNCLVNMDVKVYYNFYDRFLKSLGDGKQISFQLKTLYKVAADYKRFMVENGASIKAIKALECACRSLEIENLQLTRIHTLFVETCLRAKMYKSALRIIQKPLIHLEVRSSKLILEIDNSEYSLFLSKGIEEIDFFSYQYLCGCVYIGLKMFSQARDCFILVTQTQVRELYQVLIDSIKKLFFLNLRQSKEKMSFQGNLDSTSAFLVQMSTDLLEKSDKNLETYDRFLAVNQNELANEGNLGLAKQGRISFFLKEIKKISKIYLRLKVKDLSNETDLKLPEISQLQFFVNKVERIFKINRKLDCIEFLRGEEIDHSKQVHTPLKNLFETMKAVKIEYEKENEKMVLDRIQNPDTLLV